MPVPSLRGALGPVLLVLGLLALSLLGLAASAAPRAGGTAAIEWLGASGVTGGGFAQPTFYAQVGTEADYVNEGAAPLTLQIAGASTQTATIPPGARAEQPLLTVGTYLLLGTDVAGAAPGTTARPGERVRAVLTVGTEPAPSATPASLPPQAPSPVPPATPTSPAAGGSTQVPVASTGVGLPPMHVRARAFGLPVAAALVLLAAVGAGVIRVLLAVPGRDRR